ncbi:MAG: WhiB family transcriptional regulator [Acidimicrobiia bacterium]
MRRSPWGDEVLAEWKTEAACEGRTELFFAAHAERSDLRRRRETMARALCQVCPVLQLCRTWARERREYGFWGGESEEERAAAGYPVALPTGRVARVIREHATGVRARREAAELVGAAGVRSRAG